MTGSPMCRLDLDPFRTLHPAQRTDTQLRPGPTGTGRLSPHPYARDRPTAPASNAAAGPPPVQHPASTQIPSLARTTSQQDAVDETQRRQPAQDREVAIANAINQYRGLMLMSELASQQAQGPAALPSGPQGTNMVPPVPGTGFAPNNNQGAFPHVFGGPPVNVAGTLGLEPPPVPPSMPHHHHHHHHHHHPHHHHPASPSAPNAPTNGAAAAPVDPQQSPAQPTTHGPPAAPSAIPPPRIFGQPFNHEFTFNFAPSQPRAPPPAAADAHPPRPAFVPVPLKQWLVQRERALGWRCDALKCSLAPPEWESDGTDEDERLRDVEEDAYRPPEGVKRRMIPVYDRAQPPRVPGVRPIPRFVCRHFCHYDCNAHRPSAWFHPDLMPASCGRCGKEGWLPTPSPRPAPSPRPDDVDVVEQELEV